MRWSVSMEGIGEGPQDLALLDLHGVSCMACRRRLMYGLCRIVNRLTHLRDAVGEDYVQKKPLVHGKIVTSRESSGSMVSEAYRYRCSPGSREINPRLVDDVQEPERVTCPDCIANLEAGTVAYPP